jgi:protein ImuA
LADMNIASPSRLERLDALRAEVRALTPQTRPDVDRIPFGLAEVDGRLAGGGIAAGALHEMTGATPSLADDAAATLFAAGIAARAGEGVVLWVMSSPDLFAPALSQAGIPPSRLIQVDARRDEDALAVIEEGLRHGGLSAVVGEVARVGMTATRRLQLAAEDGATTALLLRRWRRAKDDPLSEPSAAVTRWRVASAPSTPLPAEGVGRSRWNVSLVRQRGGDPHDWLLEGCDATGRLAIPAEPRHRPAAPARRGVRRAAA